jgi:hypothetical protein
MSYSAVGRTTPNLHAFTSTLDASTFSIKVNQDPPLDTTPDALARTYARFASFGAVAKAHSKDIGPYVSTPFVARDMLAITKALGFDKLKFWGISYSTVLGLCNLFRFLAIIVLIKHRDDIRLYVPQQYRASGPGWRPRRPRLLRCPMEQEPPASSLIRSILVSYLHCDHSDTDKALEFFYQKCAEAGPAECALHEKTTDAIKARVEKIFDKLKYNPIPVAIGNELEDYGIVDYGLVRGAVLGFLYEPFTLGGKNTSIMLASLEQGDGSRLYAAEIDDSQSLRCSCDGDPSQEEADPRGSIAIQCSDGDPVNDTLSDLQEWFKNNQKHSSFADIWIHRIFCACVFIFLTRYI